MPHHHCRHTYPLEPWAAHVNGIVLLSLWGCSSCMERPRAGVYADSFLPRCLPDTWVKTTLILSCSSPPGWGPRRCRTQKIDLTLPVPNFWPTHFMSPISWSYHGIQFWIRLLPSTRSYSIFLDHPGLHLAPVWISKAPGTFAILTSILISCQPTHPCYYPLDIQSVEIKTTFSYGSYIPSMTHSNCK